MPCCSDHSRSRRLLVMTEHPAGSARQPWSGKTRAAAVGLSLGLGATLALSPMVSPLVWAQTSPTRDTTALPGQQSFAPLVKRVLPAVVNISVTEKSGAQMMSQNVPERFRGSPFEDFMRRFFDQEGRGQGMPGPFFEGPGDEGSG